MRLRLDIPTETDDKSALVDQEAKKLGLRGSSSSTWIKRTLLAAGVLAVVAALVLVAFVVFYSSKLSSIDRIVNYKPLQTTRILDAQGHVLSEIFKERRTVVPMERIPRVLVLSVLAAEDADFYHHEGLDYMGMLRAVVSAIMKGRITQGASTITQQAVKVMLLTPERTLSRKVKQLILAHRVENELSKEQILHRYLNHIYFGHGRYGVQEAANYYFNKDVSELSLAEASLIAGIPQSPARLSPRAHPEAARRRQRYVLKQLRDKRATHWPDLPLVAIDAAEKAEVHRRLPPLATQREAALRDVVVDMLGEQIDAAALREGGYSIHTTIDAKLQRHAQEALQGGLRRIDQRHHYSGRRKPRKGRKSPKPRSVKQEKLRYGKTYQARVTDHEDERLILDVAGHRAVVSMTQAQRYNPDSLPASKFAAVGTWLPVSMLHLDMPEGKPPEAALELGPQGAVVVIDPRTRHIRALVGSYEGGAGFNRAIAAKRQPGSSFKPIVYAWGIHTHQFTPASLVLDAPAVYDTWKPNNYEVWQHGGPLRLREAVAKSVNLVAIRVIESLDPQRVADFAKQLGIESPLDPSLALALGASEVSPLELVNAYATFAAGGRATPARLIAKVVDNEGKEMSLPSVSASRDLMSPAEAYVLTQMLRSVVLEGTATAARKLPWEVAGKTGTSNKARDAWFVGYSPTVVAGVWVGFDDRRPLGRRESGGRSALPVWMEVMRHAHDSQALTQFPRPEGVVSARIDPETGLLAYDGMEQAIDEVFVAGTDPTEMTTPPDVVNSENFLMNQMGGVKSDPSSAASP